MSTYMASEGESVFGEVSSVPALAPYRPYAPYSFAQNTTKCSLCFDRHQDHWTSERSMS